MLGAKSRRSELPGLRDQLRAPRMPGTLVSAIGPLLCPCHGGAYYEDGARASGPPERGLFQYQYKVEDGKPLHQSRRIADARAACRTQAWREKTVRLIQKVAAWFDLRLQLAEPIREIAGASRPA